MKVVTQQQIGQGGHSRVVVVQGGRTKSVYEETEWWEGVGVSGCMWMGVG